MQIEQSKIQHRDKLVEALTAIEKRVRDQIDKYNKVTEAAHQSLQQVAAEYNALVKEANDLIEDVITDIDAEIMTTADKEEGEALCALRDQWDVTFDTLDLDDPEYAVDPDESPAQMLTTMHDKD
jgi:hypothetical protein